MMPASLPPFLHRRAQLPRRSLVPVLRQAAPQGPVVLDSFSDADGVNLPNHNPDLAPTGSAWSNANLGISGNQAHYLTGANRQFDVIETGLSDCRISLRCCQDANGVYTSGSEYRSGIIARFSGAGNFWRIVFHPVGGFAIYEVNAGVTVIRASTAFTSGYGVFHTVSAELKGESILAEIDGQYALRFDLANFNREASKHGLTLAYSGAVPAADDFRVERV
jgi:hypothetical protein